MTVIPSLPCAGAAGDAGPSTAAAGEHGHGRVRGSTATVNAYPCAGPEPLHAASERKTKVDRLLLQLDRPALLLRRPALLLQLDLSGCPQRPAAGLPLQLQGAGRAVPPTRRPRAHD